MVTRDDDLYRQLSPEAIARAKQKRLPAWHKLSPLVWAPIMYTSRFWLRGRVAPNTQHKIFIGMTLVGLSHAGYVMRRDGTMGGGNM